MPIYIFAGLVSAIVTFCITPLVRMFAIKYKLVDDAKNRYHPAHTHLGVIPRAGGLALGIGMITSIIFFLPQTKVILGLCIGITMLVVVGLMDDRKDISPYARLVINFLAAGIVVLSGVGIPYITNPLTQGVIHLDAWKVTFQFFGWHTIFIIADFLAIIWIVWTMNIVGWSAGVDGQMPGFVAISAIVLSILSLRYSLHDPSQLFVTILSMIVAGAYIGFLPWNFYPQKIMPGYGGKTLAGFLLAILGILSYGKLGTALLVLGVPMIDAGIALVRRIGKGKSPVWADRGHLHHKLLDLGWGKRKIALFYWGVSAILGLVALSVTSQQKLFAFLLLIVGVIMLILWVNFFSQFSKPPDHDNG